MNRNNSFNLIRLLLAMQVLIVHYRFNFEFEILSIIYTFPGVPIFFFLSGYFVSLSAASFEKSGALSSFYVRRFFRIFPALLFCVGCSGILFFFIFFRENEYVPITDVITYLFANLTVFQALNLEVFRPIGLGVVNGALWSIGVEISFYLLFPIFHKLISSYNIIFILLALTSAVIYFTLPYVDKIFHLDPLLPKAISISPVPWFCFFAFGMMFKYFAELRKLAFKHTYLLCILLLVSFSFRNDTFLFHQSGNFVGPLHAILMCCLVFSLGSITPPWKTTAIDFSFGIYLWHMPAVNFLIIFWPDHFYVWFAVFLTFICAWLSWFLIEAKGIIAGKRLSRVLSKEV